MVVMVTLAHVIAGQCWPSRRLTRSFALQARPADDPAPPPWGVEAAAARFPRLGRELARDWTDIERELATAGGTVLAGAQSLADPAADL